ncbi:hypothetical protein [Cohnella thermotolerans]|nr:hypothetical protein [Cohnella thermotolerans]
MPKNSSTKADNQQNLARFKAESRTPALEKLSRLPPSLNKINKNLP